MNTSCSNHLINFQYLLGIPLLATSFSIKYRSSHGAQVHIISGLAGVILSIMFPKIKDACTHFVSTLAILSILLQSFHANSILGMAGAIIYVIASMLIGTSGSLLGYQRIDVFHYLLFLANITFVRAFQ